MSDRALDINLTKSTDTKVGINPTAEEVIEYTERLARVLDRGLIIDRLRVDHPPEFHGEWVGNDPVSIATAELKGFVRDTEYSVKTGLNDGGDGSGRAGDVVFMLMPKWKHKIMTAEVAKRYRDNHSADKRKQKEEKDFENAQKSIGMDSRVSSDVEVKTGPQIQEALSNPNT